MVLPGRLVLHRLAVRVAALPLARRALRLVAQRVELAHRVALLVVLLLGVLVVAVVACR